MSKIAHIYFEIPNEFFYFYDVMLLITPKIHLPTEKESKSFDKRLNIHILYKNIIFFKVKCYL